MSQPSEGSQPSTAPHDQPGGSREPARGRKRRAPAWSSAEIVDLIEVWGEASNVHDLRTSHRNAAVYGRMAASLAARGHQRSREQVRCKIKDLRQSYSRACLPGADPEACPHFHALDRILGPHAVPAPRDVIDPGAEGPLLDTEEEEEGSESQEPAASLPRTRDPRGTPQSRSPASSEAGEASTSAAPGTAGRTTPPAAAARARASRTARNQEDYQRRHLRFLDRQLRLQDHWVQEDLRLRQRSLEALEEQGRALRGHLQSLLDRFPFPPPPAPPLTPPLAPPAPPLAPPAPPLAPPIMREEVPRSGMVILILKQHMDNVDKLNHEVQYEASRPAGADQRAKLVPPPTRAHGSCRHWQVYNDLMRRHVEALERMEETMAERMREETQGHDRLLEEFLRQQTAICGTIGEAMGVPGLMLSCMCVSKETIKIILVKQQANGVITDGKKVLHTSSKHKYKMNSSTPHACT
ncbi:uncharacterized protein LOC142830018 [Pelodiscus sinensis]|uniref:uncharacterized protein LOC142830018 n=1 Tax=Pelodiscus sinensis TaxID=13735 RepID=UPI003F6BA04D